VSRFARVAPPLFLVLLAALPLLQVVGRPDHFLADAAGELPVKLWVFETFARVGILGGTVDTAAFPNVGPLNNPDPVGTLVTAALRPLVGRVWAYNLLVVGLLAASALSAWALARALLDDAVAALVAGVVYGFAPLVLAYAVCGAITDVLNLWPYPLAILGLLRALRAPSARAAVRPAALAGLAAGLGFVTCPYNFVVFAAMLFPAALLAPLALREGLVPAGPEVRPSKGVVVVSLLVTAVLLVIIALPDALYVRQILADPNSQMPSSAVAGTRHAPPYVFLEPGNRDRYVAWLADYVAVGKGALIERVLAARFYRVFSPGFVVFGLVLVGLVASARRWTALLWAGIAAFCMLASTGPFLPVTRDFALSTPVNLAWLLPQHLLPGASQLLEPFRYALPAGLGLAVGAAIGAHALRRRFGPAVAVTLPVLILAELAVVSPVPFPLPVARLAAPALYTELDRWLPEGAILELPYFDRGTDRFYREHFFQQLLHGRPIANEVIGFAPRYLRENQFTASLLAPESGEGRLRVEVIEPDRVNLDRARLRADGFVGIVVNPAGYATPAALSIVSARLAPLGPSVELGDRVLYRLPDP
jgi:hypothetical protein